MAESPSLRFYMRVGRSLGRTLYCESEPDKTDGDNFVGVVDTKELAAEMVRRWNLVERLDREFNGEPADSTPPAEPR